MSGVLLVVRPEPGASQTLRAARALGLKARSVPIFEVAPVAWVPPEPSRFDAIMFTSANAPRCAGPALARYTKLPAYAVGALTGSAARAAGFAQVREGASDGAALVALLAGDQLLRVLHLCGMDRREAAAPGLTIERLPVYEARAIPAPAGLAEGLSVARAVLLHSPRAAAHFAGLVDALEMPRAKLAVAAISAATAQAAGNGWAAVEIAERPDDAALLAIAAKLCD